MKVLDKIKNWKQPRLYWKDIFKYYIDQAFFQKSSVKIIHPIEEKSVLVLCPHIDDDVIGLGGTLHQYHQLGTQVSVIYFSSENNRRIEEGRKISQFLGYQNVHYGDYPPEKLSKFPKIRDEIKSLLIKNRFDVVYVPFFLDRHKDHIAVSSHFAKVIKELPRFEAEIRSYEVWSPLFPNQIVDISDAVEHKKKAILFCQSQMESVNYVDLALSLNRYRGITSTREKKIDYAECFFSCTPFMYLKFFE